MTEYQLKDRRQISDHFRKLGYGFVDFCVRRKIQPDTISYASVVFALAAGILFCLSDRYAFFLLIAPILTFGRLYCNMIDGMVAIKSQVASRRGEVINELPDRVSDTIIFLGLALSGQANMIMAFSVIFGMLAVSYIGVLGKAVGARRQYGGSSLSTGTTVSVRRLDAEAGENVHAGLRELWAIRFETVLR